MQVNPEVNIVITAAYNEAKSMGHEFITPEHILYASLFTKRGNEIIINCGGNLKKLKKEIEHHFKTRMESLPGDINPSESIAFKNIIQRAILHTQNSQKDMVELEDIFVAIFYEKESFAAYILLKEGISKVDVLNYISHGISAIPQEVGSDTDADEEGENLTENQESYEETEDEKLQKAEKVLQCFTTELVQRAAKGEMDPLIGREEILQRTIQVLCRRLKNNPVHVGEPGVGKTAITEGLAQMIAANEVPLPLKDASIYALDMGAVLAGTKFRGDFEGRMKKVLNALLLIKGSILFIDEIHTIVGAGAVSGGSMDASNILKSALVSGKMKCIGSTTYEDYKKYFDRDRALSRRFQKIEILEPTIQETCEILNGLKDRYQDYHQVRYTDGALKSAAELSAKYINDRFLPDKAIDVIDEAGSFTKINQIQGKKRKTVIKSQNIEKVVASIAKIPKKTVSKSEIGQLKRLESGLKKVIFGQNQAIDHLTNSIKRCRAGLSDSEKPVASFLFVGPTGVGKTELARQLALLMGVALHRFDMSEYREKHTVARLIGAPPGYVGFDQGGLLTEVIRKKPYSVLLLDEIEKAHPDIFNVLLQIMDYATLTDNNGKKADFRNVILIMTSNAGARDLGSQRVGFGDTSQNQEVLKDAVEKFFSPEFRNRLDKVIEFNNLDQLVVLKIVKKFIAEFALQLKEKKVTISISKAASLWIAQKGYSPIFGAREISRLVQDKIKNWFVDEILFNRLKNGGKAFVTLKDDQIFIKVTPLKP